MKYTKKEIRKVINVLLCVCAVSILTAVAFAALWFSAYRQIKNTGIREDPGDDTRQEDTGEPGTSSGEDENAVLEALKKENAELERRLAELEAGTDTAGEEKTEPSDTEPAQPIYVPIEGQFDTGDLTPADPASLSYTFDLTRQYAILAELEAKMRDVPFIVAPDGTLTSLAGLKFPEGTEVVYKEAKGTGYDSEGKPLVREIDYAAMGYTFPSVSVAYRDLERGTTYSYGGDTLLFSASLIKAPYIYTLLDQFAQYHAVIAANPENDPAVGQTLSDEILEKYDYSRKIVITESMKQKGSGSIRKMDLSDGGKEFTVLELITYAIKESDNTAFRVLRDEFGYDYFWAVSKKLGCTSVFSSFNNLTTEDAIKYLAAIYDFAKTCPDEGKLLIGLMQQSAHTVMIPAALPGKNVAHKYGWDEKSYHDMAIVYGDAPYAVCVMTNFDFPESNETLNAYIRDIVKSVDRLHESFYN